MGTSAVNRRLTCLLLVAALMPSVSAVEAAAPVAQAAQAGGTGQGNLTSTAYHELPGGFPIEVRTFDDSEINLDIRSRLIDALGRSGYLVEPGAPLELSFESAVIQGAAADSSRSSLGRVETSTNASTGNQGSSIGVDVQVNVWSSTKDSVLGGRQSAVSRGKHARFHINAILRDRENGRVLWQADAIGDLITSDEARVARAMIEPLIEAFGQSVANQSFELR